VLPPPKDPESEGVVGRRKGWFETSFMTGRRLDSPDDFNARLADWLTRANARRVTQTLLVTVEISVYAVLIDTVIGMDSAGLLRLPGKRLLYGFVLSLARALGEFGGLKIVSGSLTGQTPTTTGGRAEAQQPRCERGLRRLVDPRPDQHPVHPHHLSAAAQESDS